MKTYREQYNDLHFSPEEKQAMVENLLAAVPETQKRVSHKKRLHVLIAAVIAAALCAACASGALRSASEVFANLFGSSQEQASLLEQLGTPLGVSCTQDGLTITADAILADEYTYAILYSIQREDGTSLRADEARVSRSRSTRCSGLSRPSVLLPHFAPMMRTRPTRQCSIWRSAKWISPSRPAA